MNVLLLNPTRTGMDTYVTPPLHLVYIAHAIRRAGHNSEILDVHYQYSKARNTNKAKFDFENEMIEEIMGRDFDLLGIGSIASGYHFSKRQLPFRRNTASQECVSPTHYRPMALH